MVPVRLHPLRRDPPFPRLKVHLVPPRAAFQPAQPAAGERLDGFHHSAWLPSRRGAELRSGKHARVSARTPVGRPARLAAVKRLVAKGAGLAEPRSAVVPSRRQGGVRRESRDRGLPRSGLEFPGCYRRPMTRAEYAEHEGRVEFFDSRAEIAWMVREPAHAPHERPRNRLGHLLERIAQVRGSAIESLGAVEIRRTEPGSGEHHSIHADQMAFLHPDRTEGRVSQYLDVGEDPYPDVVLEVDSTTDVRRNRLVLYEAWGFPEVWVEVPDAYAPSRPAGLRSGLRIYRLEGGRYALSGESRAFPGWRAVEIHRALNGRVVSQETSAVLSRVGRALGEREGTGPDDDPLLREQRAEGRAEGRSEMIRALLRQRELPVPPDFPAGLAPRDRDALHVASEERILAAASAADNFADFLARLDSSGA